MLAIIDSVTRQIKSSLGGFREIPAPDSAFSVVRDGVVLVGTPLNTADVCRVAFEDTQALPRLDVPQPHRSVFSTGEKMAAVVGPSHRDYISSMTFEDTQALASLNIP
jgi:hypothetical protein